MLSALYGAVGTAVVYLLAFGAPAALVLEALARAPRRDAVAVRRDAQRRG